MLSPQRLSLFREVVRCGSLASAARQLAFTQSAVSQQIAALERETGVSLLERSHRGVRPTAAGRALARHADKIVAQLGAAERELEAIAAGEAGDVRLAAFPTAAAAVVTRAIAELERRRPRIEVTLTEADPDESLALLRSGEIDIALDFDWDVIPAEPGSEFTAVPLLSEDLLVALPAAHGLARRRHLRLPDLRDEMWIGGPYGCTEILTIVCGEAGFTPSLVFECNDYGIAQGLIASGIGVALIPAFVLANLRADLVARRVPDVRVRRRTRALLHADAYRMPAVAAVLALLAELAAEAESADEWRKAIHAAPTAGPQARAAPPAGARISGRVTGRQKLRAQ
jgi:DNA-binding transcriptional LysR family regulator